MKLALRLSAAVALSLGAAALAGAQGTTCARPGMNVVPSCSEPVVFDDGATDYIEVQPGTPLTFEYSLAGQGHAGSLAISAGYATFALYSVSPAEVPFPLTPCADLALPFNASVLPVPSATLELDVQIDLPPSAPATVDLWHQTLSVDLLTPGFPMATSDLARVRFQKEACDGDPSASQEYDCYYWGYYVWNQGQGNGPVQGRIYWPSDCTPGTDPAGVHPVVLLAHGEGGSYTDYHYLMRHLAFNGFIAASIDVGQGLENSERAARIHDYWNFIRDQWEYQDHVENSVGLVGHGRGAEAVLRAIRMLPNLAGPIPDVRAAVLLSPTNQGENGILETGYTSFFGKSLLVIHGSLDNEVTGYCTDGTLPGCGAPPSGPQRTGFAIYDNLGGEESNECTVPSAYANPKSMLFVEGADHQRWRDQPCVDPPPFMANKPLDCETHHDIAEAYVNAFARWRLRGQDEYEPYFTGEWTPGAVAAKGVAIRTQYSGGTIRVLDNFETGTYADSELTTYQTTGFLAAFEDETPFDHGNDTSPHDTSALVVQWAQTIPEPQPRIRWSVVPQNNCEGDPWRDFTVFETLSFRAGLVDGASPNPFGEGTNFSVRLVDGQGAISLAVQVEDVTELAYPHQSVVTTPLLFTAATAKSAMSTVRIPIEDFKGIDLSNVWHVELWFDDPDHPQGEILLDSLELSR